MGPNAAISNVLSTRREALNVKHRQDEGIRGKWLVENHLHLLKRNMGPNATVPGSLEHEEIVVLLWSGAYPVWLARLTMGNVQKMQDGNYNSKHNNRNVTALACMLYGQCSCRVSTPQNLQERRIDDKHLANLGITWENTWKGGYDHYKTQSSAVGDESIPSQLHRLQQHVPYNLIPSYKLDSHIPVRYGNFANSSTATEYLRGKNSSKTNNTRSRLIPSFTRFPNAKLLYDQIDGDHPRALCFLPHWFL
jgi:hypothetical protein